MGLVIRLFICDATAMPSRLAINTARIATYKPSIRLCRKSEISANNSRSPTFNPPLITGTDTGMAVELSRDKTDFFCRPAPAEAEAEAEAEVSSCDSRVRMIAVPSTARIVPSLRETTA